MKLLTPGEHAPEFEIEDLSGRHVRLADFHGQPVLLYFLRGFA